HPACSIGQFRGSSLYFPGDQGIWLLRRVRCSLPAQPPGCRSPRLLHHKFQETPPSKVRRTTVIANVHRRVVVRRLDLEQRQQGRENVVVRQPLEPPCLNARQTLRIEVAPKPHY